MSISARFRWFTISTLATVAAIFIPYSGRAAEQITASYPPFKDMIVSVGDLEAFAKEGKIPADYANFAKQTSPEQLQQFRQLLRQRLAVTPKYVSQLTNAPLVERLLERIGESIQPESRTNGMKALRLALIRAAEDRQEGLTIINFLRQFPSRQIEIDLSEIFAIYDNVTELYKRRNKTIAIVDSLANAEAVTERRNFTGQLDLRRAGTIRWQKRRFDWLDKSRQRRVPGDLYLPQSNSPNPVPVIVISHGVAGDRTTYGYLAQHLASYGYAVVAIEHTGGDANRFRKYFSGLAPAPKATELLERPRDVSFLLDELQRRSQSDPSLRQLNLSNVGLVGHSLGGYTVLALAGAQIDFERVKRDCSPNRSLNLSVLLQCRANELTPKPYALKDPRVKAIFAISPLASTIFGKQGISQINTPTFLMGGSDDLVTPAVPEQIYPFTWLPTPDKYLAILNKGTHFSTLSIANSDSIFPVFEDLIGPDPAQAQIYTKALSLAFFQTHLANQRGFQTYLTAAYGKSIEPFKFPVSSNFQSSLVIKYRQVEIDTTLRLNLVRASAAEAIAQSLAQDTTSVPKLTP